jgi:hypothetical protein
VDKRIADPIIGLETGSARLFNTYMNMIDASA